MSVQTANITTTIKETIRTLQSDNGQATQDAVFNAFRRNTKQPFDRVRERYETLRKQGEIYSYPSGGVVVVRVTDDAL